MILTDYHHHLDSPAIISKCSNRKEQFVTILSDKQGQEISYELWTWKKAKKNPNILVLRLRVNEDE